MLQARRDHVQTFNDGYALIGFAGIAPQLAHADDDPKSGRPPSPEFAQVEPDLKQQFVVRRQ